MGKSEARSATLGRPRKCRVGGKTELLGTERYIYSVQGVTGKEMNG